MTPVTPLCAAAHNGHLEVVRELERQLGIMRCGGGGDALEAAAGKNRVDIMRVLTVAGVLTAAGLREVQREAKEDTEARRLRLEAIRNLLLRLRPFTRDLGCGLAVMGPLAQMLRAR
eukprot:g14996.t1